MSEGLSRNSYSFVDRKVQKADFLQKHIPLKIPYYTITLLKWLYLRPNLFNCRPWQNSICLIILNFNFSVYKNHLEILADHPPSHATCSGDADSEVLRLKHKPPKTPFFSKTPFLQAELKEKCCFSQVLLLFQMKFPWVSPKLIYKTFL